MGKNCIELFLLSELSSEIENMASKVSQRGDSVIWLVVLGLC